MATAYEMNSASRTPALRRNEVVLVVSSSAQASERLRTDIEMREIKAVLVPSLGTRVECLLATRTRDLQAALMRYRPKIVHFCGHGSRSGLLFEDDSRRTQQVPLAALAELFRLTRFLNLRCVFLNACYSAGQADAISKHVEYVIGLEGGIPDKGAIRFATGFYDALASGASISDSFDLAVNGVRLDGWDAALVSPIFRKGERLGGDTLCGLDLEEMAELSKNDLTQVVEGLRAELPNAAGPTHGALGVALVRLGREQEARKHLEAAMENSFDPPEVLFAWALAAVSGRLIRIFSETDIKHIADILQKAIAADPTTRRYLLLLGIIESEWSQAHRTLEEHDFSRIFRQARKLRRTAGDIEEILRCVAFESASLRELICGF